jgi:hypothetical protein
VESSRGNWPGVASRRFLAKGRFTVERNMRTIRSVGNVSQRYFDFMTRNDYTMAGF